MCQSLSRLLHNHTIFGPLSDVARAIKTLRKRKTQTRKETQKYKNFLKPGIYLINDNIASHFGSKSPTSLSDPPSNSNISSLRPLIIKLLRKAIPPILMSVNHHRKSTATHLLLPDAHGEVKIFNFENNTVSTFFADESELERLKEAYVHLTYLPLTKMRFPTRESLLVSEEEYVDGKPFFAETYKKRLVAWKSITSSLKTPQNFAVKTLDRQSPVSYYFRTALNSDIPTSLRNTLVESKTQIIECIITSPNIWAHGDLYGGNVLIRDNNTPVIIDIMTCRQLPFFYDVINLLANDIIQNPNSIITSFIENDAGHSPWNIVKEQFRPRHSYSLETYLLSFLVLYLGKIRKTDSFGSAKWEPLNTAIRLLSHNRRK